MRNQFIDFQKAFHSLGWTTLWALITGHYSIQKLYQHSSSTTAASQNLLPWPLAPHGTAHCPGSRLDHEKNDRGTKVWNTVDTVVLAR